ncbi:MAG: adenylate cyclase [Nitrospina sp.]|nr:MAG: adenylate cyclase [Nitrospina sp.]
MTANTTDISSTLFNNRQLFIRYNKFKIHRILQTLSTLDGQVFTVIPRLLHANQKGLPGYIQEDVPCGIHNFTLNAECRFASERLFPNIIIRRNEQFTPFIETVLLMGSTGSIAQSQKSDSDFTIFINKDSVPDDKLSLFQKKLQMIEEWTWKTYKLEIHFFINDIQEVKNNIFGESNTESTGSALAKLLKEEMYRTAVIPAGKIPFWWIFPVNTDDDQYEFLVRQIQSNQTLLNANDFLDIGNVDDISQGEFFGGSIWALIKSFKSPFKTLMKMGLLEEYMFNDTRSNLLCHEIKKKVFIGTPHEQIDTYLNLFERVDKFFSKTKPDIEVDALRISFYLKVGTKVDRQDLEEGSSDPYKKVLIKLIRGWNWPEEKVLNLNSYLEWPMMEKVALGENINKILMSSYKNISEANSRLAEGESLITERDTHLLGRKLFSFYRKTANKVENLFALVDGDTNEKELTFLLQQSHTKGKHEWYLIRGKTLAFIEQIPEESIIKKASSLQFLIAFTCFNNLYNEDTALLLRAEHTLVNDIDLKNLLGELSSFLSQMNIADIANEKLLATDHIQQAFIIADFGSPVPREITMENIQDCKNASEYSKFINKRLQKIRSVVTIYLTSWGELFCKTYSGLNCVSHCLVDLAPRVTGSNFQNQNFLKLFVPGSRKDTDSFQWLEGYFIKSLKIRSTGSKN